MNRPCFILTYCLHVGPDQRRPPFALTQYLRMPDKEQHFPPGLDGGRSDARLDLISHLHEGEAQQIQSPPARR